MPAHPIGILDHIRVWVEVFPLTFGWKRTFASTFAPLAFSPFALAACAVHVYVSIFRESLGPAVLHPLDPDRALTGNMALSVTFVAFSRSFSAFASFATALLASDIFYQGHELLAVQLVQGHVHELEGLGVPVAVFAWSLPLL